MPSEDAKTKGVGFVNVRAFAAERFGAHGWDQTLDSMTPADRDALASIVPVGWYSLALYARLIRALDEAHGAGDLALVVQLGRFEAEHDLTTIHRIFLRMANPAFAIEKFGDYWRRFHDSGTWVLSRESPTNMIGRLSDWGVVDHALCRELVGYMGRVLELVGAKNVVLEHPKCRGRGDAECLFLARWGGEVVRRQSGSMRIATPPAAPREEHASGRVPIAAPREERPSDAFASSVEKLKGDSKRRSGGE